MRQSSFLRIFVATFFICSILFFAATAQAAATISLTAACHGSTADATVNVRRVENRYSLYLPGIWDASAVTVQLEGCDAITAGDLLIENGATVDFTSILGQKQTLKNSNGHTLGTLTVYQGSSLPAIFLTVDEDELSAVNKSKDYTIETGHVTFAEDNGDVTYDGELTSFRGRGNSTFAYKKKPYQLKLSKKADLCGMGKSKTWLLLANWIDLSLLRNQIMLNLCQEIGIPYAVECSPVDVYINGNYNGLYLLTEKIQINKSRVDITNLEDENELLNGENMQVYGTFNEQTDALDSIRGYELPEDPEDITGGYILEIEKGYRYRSNIDNGFVTGGGISVTIKEPTCASRAQVLYIGNLFNDFHNALLAKDGINPSTGLHYSEYIDVSSFALKFLVEEFSKNYDALASSQFFFKDSDEIDTRIYAGPCWDYDLCMGNIRTGSFQKGTTPTGTYVTNKSSKANLYWCLANHDDFNELLYEEYVNIMRPALSILTGQSEAPSGSYLKSFADYKAAISDSAAMNFARWPAGNVHGYYTGSGTNFEASCTYLLNWMTKRMNAMDELYGAAQ